MSLKWDSQGLGISRCDATGSTEDHRESILAQNVDPEVNEASRSSDQFIEDLGVRRTGNMT